MCPLSTPSHSGFDWNRAPLLVKEQIVDSLSPHGVVLLSAVSKECRWLCERRRQVFVVSALSVSVEVKEDGTFVSKLLHGEDTGRNGTECCFHRQATNHLSIVIEHGTKEVFEDKLHDLLHALQVIHPLAALEVDVFAAGDANSEVVRETLDAVCAEVVFAAESARKIVVHRFPEHWIEPLCAHAVNCSDLAFVSTRRLAFKHVDPKILCRAVRQLPRQLIRFVCDYLIRPNDDVFAAVRDKAPHLQLLFIYGLDDEAIGDYVAQGSFAAGASLMFGFSEGFYNWNRVESALKRASSSLKVLPAVTTVRRAYSLQCGDTQATVALFQPYRAQC